MPFTKLLPAFVLLCLISGCEKPVVAQPGVKIVMTGSLASARINEASGMQASNSYAGDFFVHNDDSDTMIYAVNEKGTDLGSVRLVPARNLDWEDIASVPVKKGHWLVLGDIGDNLARRPYITLYFTREPVPGKNQRYGGVRMLEHRLDLTYPDGPRDCESLAYDPLGKQLLLLSKRDKPARLYAVDLAAALSQNRLELEFLGTIRRLRPPTVADRAAWGGRADWISQPTGLDIAADGSEAVLVTYRSLYRYQRRSGEDWLTALQREPLELVGPPGPQNEAVAYSTNGHYVYVTSENLPAPIYRIQF